MVERGERISKCANHELIYNQQLWEGNIAKRPLEKPQFHSLSRERARAL
jgi:hypothetical protein